MALSLENANKVRQKLRSGNLNYAVYLSMKAFFLFWATQKSNADLQFVPFTSNEMGSDGDNADKVIADVACKIYVFYAKKRATATAVFMKGTDHATASSASDPTDLWEFTASGQIALAIHPDGFDQGTGWTVRQDTADISGSTRTLLANGADGFYILGAA